MKIFGKLVVESDNLPNIPPPQFASLDHYIHVTIWFPKTIRRRFPAGARKTKRAGNVKRYTVWIGHDLWTNKLVVKGERP